MPDACQSLSGPAALHGKPAPRLLGAVGLLLMLTACRGTYSRIQLDPDDAGAKRYAITGDIEAEIRDLALPVVQRGKTPGLVVGVLLPDGDMQFFGFGVARPDAPHPPDSDTLFAIGSTTKGFLSATAAVLVQDGLLSWEDTLGELLPDDAGLSRDAKAITLLELATHSSGLPRQPFSLRLGLYFMQYLFSGENFFRHIDSDYVFANLRRFRSPSVRNPTYSNIGYGLLGHVLEIQTGQSLDALMREALLGPLQLHSTGFQPELLPGYGERAQGHAGDQPKFVRTGKPVPEWEFTDILLGAAGLYASAGDLLAYARAHLHTVDDGTLDAALRDTLEARLDLPRFSRALAWALDDIDGRTIIYQVGFVNGFSSYIGMDPENGTAVVVLQNSLNWTESIGHRLLLRMARAADAK